MRALSAQDLALALGIAIAVSQSRSRRSLEGRIDADFVDECIAFFNDPRLSPVVTKLGHANDEHEADRRRLCAETLEYFEAIRALVKDLSARA